MKPDEYIQERLQDQIDWYDQKSSENQQAFKHLRKAEIIAAALIPFTSGLTASIKGAVIAGSIATGLLGVAITIFASILALGQHQENWIEYRTTCESLKKEKFMFQTGVEPYDGEDSFTLLVQRVETLVSKENTNWAQYMMKPDEEKKHGER
jgi:uncharacterized protein DUF4231